MDHHRPTPFPALNDVLQELIESVQAILGEVFVAACLQGSFAVGDFDEHSDVDWIIAIREELSAGQVRALQAMHDRIYRLESSWAQHLEGSYFPQQILRDHARTGGDLWYLDNGAKSLIRSDHCNTLVVRSTVREHGVMLAGPSPRSLVDPVPVASLQKEILATLNGWGEEILRDPGRYSNRFYQGFIVLNYCRMLHDLGAGRVSSKRESAEWAKAALDASWAGLIDRAWSGRPNPAVSVRQPADPAEMELTLAFLRYVMDKSREIAEETGLLKGDS